MAYVDLYVNEIVSAGAWTPVGTTPYLNAQDQPTNYIHSNSRNANSDVFGFQDSSDLGTITKVELFIYAQQGGAGDDFTTIVNSTDTLLGPPATWGWVSVDVTSIVGTTWAGVNAATMYFDKPNTPNDPAVDCAYLRVTYSAGPVSLNTTQTGAVTEAKAVTVQAQSTLAPSVSQAALVTEDSAVFVGEAQVEDLNLETLAQAALVTEDAQVNVAAQVDLATAPIDVAQATEDLQASVTAQATLSPSVQEAGAVTEAFEVSVEDVPMYAPPLAIGGPVFIYTPA